MKRKNPVKLSPGAKNILNKMQDQQKMYYSGTYQTYRMNCFSLNRKSVHILIDAGLIERSSDMGQGSYYLIITQKGKDISI